MDAVCYSDLSLLSGSNYGYLIGPMEALRKCVCVRVRERDQQSVSVLMYVGEAVHDLR